MAELKNAGYYEAMAQALPVLFIVLFIEYRETRASWEPLRRLLPCGDTVTPLLALAVGLWIGLGEFATLDVLRHQDVTVIDSVLIDGGLSLAALGLLAPITISLVEELAARDAAPAGPRLSRRRATTVYVIVGTIWLLAILYFTPSSPLR